MDFCNMCWGGLLESDTDKRRGACLSCWDAYLQEEKEEEARRRYFADGVITERLEKKHALKDLCKLT